MKKLIGSDIGNYIFNKTNRTISLTGLDVSLSLDNILIITNVTSNIMIYNFANNTIGGTIANNILTLNYNTSAMADTDVLQIFVDIVGPENESESENFKLMERIIGLLSSNSSVNVNNLKMMIADSVPGYPITSEGIGVGINRVDLIQTPSISIGQYPVYIPDPTFDDPDNINNNYRVEYRDAFPERDLYALTQVKHLTVSRGPIDQRWEIINDSQIEYGFAIRDKLSWS